MAHAEETSHEIICNKHKICEEIQSLFKPSRVKVCILMPMDEATVKSYSCIVTEETYSYPHSLPGGHVEEIDNRCLVRTADRELAEELGLDNLVQNYITEHNGEIKYIIDNTPREMSVILYLYGTFVDVPIINERMIRNKLTMKEKYPLRSIREIDVNTKKLLNGDTIELAHITQIALQHV